MFSRHTARGEGWIGRASLIGTTVGVVQLKVGLDVHRLPRRLNSSG